MEALEGDEESETEQEERMEAVIEEEREPPPVARVRRRRSLGRGGAALQVGPGRVLEALTLPQVVYQAEGAATLEDLQRTARPRRVGIASLGTLLAPYSSGAVSARPGRHRPPELRQGREEEDEEALLLCQYPKGGEAESRGEEGRGEGGGGGRGRAGNGG